MRKVLTLLTAVILIGASSGCGPGKPNHDDGRTEAEKQQAVRNSTFGPMVGTLDRARGVAQLQQDRKSKLDAATENSEGR